MYLGGQRGAFRRCERETEAVIVAKSIALKSAVGLAAQSGNFCEIRQPDTRLPYIIIVDKTACRNTFFISSQYINKLILLLIKKFALQETDCIILVSVFFLAEKRLVDDSKMVLIEINLEVAFLEL